MDRCCSTCKWFRSSTCRCKDFANSVNIMNNDTRYIDYIEEGVFSENVKENIDLNKIARNFIESLSNQGYLRKNRDALKANFEDVEPEIFEYIELMLGTSIQNFFRTQVGSEFKIENPQEFNCAYWV